MNQKTIESICSETESKIVFLIIDGLGGMAHPETGKTELETAQIPNLDQLAKESLCGLSIPIDLGITPGSGPAHLAIFGYDPIENVIGRGVLEALGLGIDLEKDDLACRANFATYDYGTKIVIDRRAGRIPTEKCVELCSLLQKKIRKIDNTKIYFYPGKGHRFVVIFRSKSLSSAISENDPQKDNFAPKSVKALKPIAKKTADIVNQFLSLSQKIMKNFTLANYILLRGFAKHPNLPTMQELYKLDPAAIATYPMYRGLACLVGMKILSTGKELEDEINTLEKNFANHNFFFLHIKETDLLGEDGNFQGKVKKLEEIDYCIPRVRKLNPDVLIVTGDHSTPAVLKGHSWHPVPFLLWSKYGARDEVKRFTETECRCGSLGLFSAQKIMSLALAYSGKLTKYGA